MPFWLVTSHFFLTPELQPQNFPSQIRSVASSGPSRFGTLKVHLSVRVKSSMQSDIKWINDIIYIHIHMHIYMYIHIIYVCACVCVCV